MLSPSRRVPVAILLVACASLAAPAAAQAETFFVNQSGSGSECTETAPCTTIALALAASRAAPGTGDRIEVGPGLYVERVAIDKAEDSGLALHGAGRGPDQEATPADATTIRSPETNVGPAVGISTASAVMIESLRVEVPAGFINTEGISLGGPAAGVRDVRVEDRGGNNTDGIYVFPNTADTTIQNATVHHHGDYRGIAVFGPRATILDSDVFAAQSAALDTEQPAETTRIVRSRLVSDGGAIAAIRSPDVVIDTSLLLGGSIGVEVFSNFGATREVRLTNDTIDVGKPKLVDTSGVAARARAESGATARAVLINTVAVEKQEVEGTATQSVSCRSSLVPLQEENVSEGTIECGAGDGNLSAPPTAVFAPGSDWHLIPGSPAVDSGAAGEAISTTDLDGNARVIDGNRDGVAMIDRGAFELPTPPPPAPPAAPAPSSAFTFGRLKRNERKGTAKLEVTVPGPGGIVLSGKRVKRAALTAAAAGTYSLSIVPNRKLARTLRSKHSTKTSISVTFTPTGGAAASRARAVRLVRKPG